MGLGDLGNPFCARDCRVVCGDPGCFGVGSEDHSLHPARSKSRLIHRGWPPFPVAGLENQIALVENEIRASLRYRPLQWLGVRAFRSHTGYFVAGIVEYCKAQSSDVVDSRMISGWLHGAAAEKLGEFAGDFVSGGCQIAVAVLGALGIAFAVPW